MAKRLSMVFITAQGGQTSLTLDAPKENLTGTEVRVVMEAIVANNIFNTTKGDLTDVKAAEITTTTKEVLI